MLMHYELSDEYDEQPDEIGVVILTKTLTIVTLALMAYMLYKEYL